MAHASPETAVRTNVLVRALIYTMLILFAVYYLLPLYVMLVNSVKPLDEIRQGDMMALPQVFTIAPWLSAWSAASQRQPPLRIAASPAVAAAHGRRRRHHHRCARPAPPA